MRYDGIEFDYFYRSLPLFALFRFGVDLFSLGKNRFSSLREQNKELIANTQSGSVLTNDRCGESAAVYANFEKLSNNPRMCASVISELILAIHL